MDQQQGQGENRRDASTAGSAGTGRTQGETHGRDQEPTHAGDQDPAARDPRPDGPMVQPADPDEASDAMGRSPDAAYGQREGQAEG
jgi:hypothetical protein